MDKKCYVGIHISVPRDKMEHIFNAEKELSKAGITFDTGSLLNSKTFSRDWEFDFSLKGPIEVEFKKFIE